KTQTGFSYNGKGIGSAMVNVDYDFFDVLGIRPLSGRGFGRGDVGGTASSPVNVVVTESMAKQFGSEGKVGLTFYPDSAAAPWRIIGIIPDLHLYSMNDLTGAVTFLLNSAHRLDYLFVKVRTENPLAAMHLVTAAYRELEPDNTVNPSYITENTERWYDTEQRLSSIFFYSAFIAIVLSCLGLFGIVSLVMEQRRKEIGVRKVLGATIASMTRLLSKDFIRL